MTISLAIDLSGNSNINIRIHWRIVAIRHPESNIIVATLIVAWGPSKDPTRRIEIGARRNIYAHVIQKVVVWITGRYRKLQTLPHIGSLV